MIGWHLPTYSDAGAVTQQEPVAIRVCAFAFKSVDRELARLLRTNATQAVAFTHKEDEHYSQPLS
jgi:hypothetical protein